MDESGVRHVTGIPRLIYFTFVWCFMFPLIFWENRGWRRIKGPSDMLFVSPRQTVKRMWRLCRQGEFLEAFELFWSKWNPLITEETARPLYKMCGGNQRPVLSTLVVFLYSGIFLHWLGVFGSLYVSNLLTYGTIPFPHVVMFYVAIGLVVALSKAARRHRNKSRSLLKLKALPSS